MTAKTSETHPIRVDFIAAEKLPLPGRIGLTFAPGKKHLGLESGLWNRDLDQDLARLRDFHQTTVLVSLIEESEFEELGISGLRQRVCDFGMESIWFPIRDVSVPTSMERFAETIAGIVRLLNREETVVIHCKGGLGRSGMVAAAILTAAGIPPQEAITAVRKARPGAIETDAQAEYVWSFHRFIASGLTE